ncbi:hypothetical protein PRK78_007508 [Emydomyces testavorans]|uniref:HNH nuclease domain-containing protein n=1 Tax=Emydomyces testavorans TaxID=2070801 RepID=A0AAF0ILQ9_9EURO|nr:hypothetical protein PRK78_007508 [Emydomyces testavorans]
MPRDRAAYRNVRFHNASTGATIGGFYQNGSITEENLLRILNDILLIVEDGQHAWTIQHRASGRTIAPSSKHPVELGDYDIYSTGSIKITQEPWLFRLTSPYPLSGQADQFQHAIRARDGKCVISGQGSLPAQLGDWTGLEAAHVFPLEKESLWNELDSGRRWITNNTDDDDDDTVGVASIIHSTQNGLLMSAHLHRRFDQYLFSIDPDPKDDYKIVEFGPDGYGIDGRILDPVCRDPTNTNGRVSDELLRWHFRQSVLANMRGAGEPIFESDFPSGSDMMATLRDELYGRERFEMELESRLRSEITNH